MGGKLERARLEHVKAKEAAVAAGTMQPSESLLMDAVINIMANPWDTPASTPPPSPPRAGHRARAADPIEGCRAPLGLGFGRAAPPTACA